MKHKIKHFHIYPVTYVEYIYTHTHIYTYTHTYFYLGYFNIVSVIFIWGTKFPWSILEFKICSLT